MKLEENLNIQDLSFKELNTLLKEINYKKLTNSQEAMCFGKKLKQWHYETVNELNLRSYEGKLYKRNLRDLGPISRPKYDRLVLFSKLIMDGIFLSKTKNKFYNLNILIPKDSCQTSVINQKSVTQLSQMSV